MEVGNQILLIVIHYWFILALLFVLAEKFNLRGEERKIVENNIVKDSKEDIGVQITLDNNNKRLPL